MNKMEFMKMYIIVGIMVLFIILGICVYIYGQENNTKKNLPENTLAVFEINNETVYLLYVRLIDRKDSDAIADFIDYHSIGNGDYFIRYSIIKGNYPKTYNEAQRILHIIPQDSIYKFETIEENFYQTINYEEFRYIIDPLDYFNLAGYSSDKNLLETKIFEYYINNKNEN
jgi:hypothetical protein